jgi:hypothetical protein
VPPLPESPEVATGLEVALPEVVRPVFPELPDVARVEPGHDGNPPQVGDFHPALWLSTGLPPHPWLQPLDVGCLNGGNATALAFPVDPELPELPEVPDWAFPFAVAGPVLPELASPDCAVVVLLLDDVALPEVPPVVVPVAVELPLRPDLADAWEWSVARPVRSVETGPDLCPETTGTGCPEAFHGVVACAELAAKRSAPPASPLAHSVFRCLRMVRVPFENATCRSGTTVATL